MSKKSKRKPSKNIKMPDTYLKEMIVNKVRAGHSPMIVIVGETGKGKSMYGLLLAEDFSRLLYNKEFNIDKNCFYDIQDFSRDLMNIERGVVMLEEAGVSLPADEWQDIFNKTFNRIQQTQRFRNNLYILVLPHVKFLARNHRYFITVLVKKTSKTGAVVYFINVDHSDFSGNWLRRFRVETIVNIPLPSQEKQDQYNKRDIANKKRIHKELVTRQDRKSETIADIKQEMNRDLAKILKEADV